MGFYDLSKEERVEIVRKISNELLNDLNSRKHTFHLLYFSDADTYIRKSTYLAIGRIYQSHKNLRTTILHSLDELFQSNDEKVRQTVVNAAGEIGLHDFDPIVHFMEKGLFDEHHAVRNAVIGSIKKMGEKNPLPVLKFARKYLHHPNKEIRREICHGIELRGRKYPQDILPLLKELQFEATARVRNTLVHVLGQIAYKKGCLETVIEDLKGWENEQLVKDALEEIIDVHHRYRSFAIKTQEEAKAYINRHFPVG